jgi:hypothetical protein
MALGDMKTVPPRVLYIRSNKLECLLRPTTQECFLGPKEEPSEMQYLIKTWPFLERKYQGTEN